MIAAALQAMLSPAGVSDAALRMPRSGPAIAGGRTRRRGPRRPGSWNVAACGYEIEAGGRVRHVTVSRTGDTFAVSVDGRLHQVDFARIDAHTLSLIVDRRAAVHASRGGSSGPACTSGRVLSTRSVVPDGRRGGRLVVLRRQPCRSPSRLNGRRARRTGRRPSRPRSGPLRIVAPMPGKIVRVLVRAGDPVRARQPVVVVEAMKMENELRADRDGTVAEIHAREGMSVESGALLIVIQ